MLDIPLLGKIWFCIPSGSSTSLYEDWIRNELDIPAELIFTGATAPTLALGAASAYRNDVICVFPGAYLQAAELAWSKANTHMVGLGGPNQGGDWSEPNVVIYTTGTALASVLNVTGQNCVFRGITFDNYGANAACVSAVKVNKYAATFIDCQIAGNMLSQQDASANCCSLWIAEAGMYPKFINCQIGQDVWGNRTTANAGVIKYETTSGASAGRPNGSDFINCRILSTGDDANCAMVRVTAATAIGRGHRFDNCIFSHFSANAAGTQTLAKAFYTPSTAVQRHIIHLHNCMAIGIDEWQTDDDIVVMADMPIVGTGGGLARNPTTVTGS
uniref:Pectate lyase n=1 Tax=viral metagenome TaxID=1070528 RepID=A0A6M3L6E1_9ZZZZ